MSNQLLEPENPSEKHLNHLVNFFPSLDHGIEESCFVLKHLFTVFENHRKSLIQNGERSELRLPIELSSLKIPKNDPFGRVFVENLWLVVKQCYKSLLIGQKLMGNAKIEKCEWDIFTVPRMIDLYFISSKL